MPMTLYMHEIVTENEASISHWAQDLIQAPSEVTEKSIPWQKEALNTPWILDLSE